MDRRTKPTKSQALSALLLCALAATPPIPDQWGPFQHQRVVADSGARYVVIRKDGKGITFEYCARADGAAAIAPASHSYLEKDPETPVDRDPADRLLAKGKVGQLPLKVMVPDGMDGFLLFDRYGSVGYASIVTWVDGEGQVAVDLDLDDLFGGPPEGAMRTVSSLWWNEAVWVDTKARSVVLVAVGDVVREVAIPSGEVTEPDLDRCLEWLDGGTEEARVAAMALLTRRGGEAADRAAPRALELFHDEGEPIGLRMRAAVLVAASGAKVDARDLFLAAVDDEGLADADRQYALENLFAAIGADALPVLRERMRGKAGMLWPSCIQGFSRAGEAAVPVLLEMLAEQGATNDYRGGAAHALKAIGGGTAVPGLVAALDDDSEYVADSAGAALVANGSPEARRALIGLLEAGTDRVAQIGRYFVAHPGGDAIEAIEKALEDAGDERTQATLQRALSACREAAGG